MKNKTLATFLFLFAMPFLMFGQDLVQWRGKNRDGIYHEKNLLKQWPAEGPKLLWHFDDLGKGHAAVLVAKDLIFTTGMGKDTMGYVFALHMDGKLKWKTQYGKEWIESWPGTRTTPTYSEGKLYLVSTFGLALCLDANTGKILWQIDMVKQFGGKLPKWGFCEMPLIINEKVIFTPGGDEVNIVALNKKDGKLIWKAKCNGEATSYCSPALIEHKGKKMIVTHTANSVIAVDPADGTFLWSYPKTNRWSVHPNTPIYEKGKLYCVSGYGSGGFLLQIADDGKSVTEVWKNTTLDNQMGGVILMNGKIYGSGQIDKRWQCLDWETGKELFSSTAISKGNIISADGMLYGYGDKGEIALFKPTETSFEQAGKFNVTMGADFHWAHLVIHNGIMYVRHGSVLMAYEIK